MSTSNHRRAPNKKKVFDMGMGAIPKPYPYPIPIAIGYKTNTHTQNPLLSSVNLKFLIIFMLHEYSVSNS